MYSDGLVEQWGPNDVAFGLGPLVEALRDRGPLGPAFQQLQQRLLDFVGERGLADDVTAVAFTVG
jgi:hypothetical protein